MKLVPLVSGMRSLVLSLVLMGLGWCEGTGVKAARVRGGAVGLVADLSAALTGN